MKTKEFTKFYVVIKQVKHGAFRKSKWVLFDYQMYLEIKHARTICKAARFNHPKFKFDILHCSVGKAAIL